MKKGLICFDMDNTLVYSDRVHVAAFHKSFRKNNLPIVPARKLALMFGVVAKVIIKELFPKLDQRKAEKVIRDHDRFVVNYTAKYVRVIKGVKHALKVLGKDYALALLSNVKHKEIVAILKAARIERSSFAVLIGNDEVKNPKPAPDAVRLAMKRTGISKGYVVGDTVYDVRAGKGAGLGTIAVLTGHHSRTRLKKEKPDFVLKSVAGLPKLLG